MYRRVRQRHRLGERTRSTTRPSSRSYASPTSRATRGRKAGKQEKLGEWTAQRPRAGVWRSEPTETASKSRRTARPQSRSCAIVSRRQGERQAAKSAAGRSSARSVGRRRQAARPRSSSTHALVATRRTARTEHAHSPSRLVGGRERRDEGEQAARLACLGRYASTPQSSSVQLRAAQPRVRAVRVSGREPTVEGGEVSLLF